MRIIFSTLLTIAFSLISKQVIGQDLKDNYSFFKLYVTNEDGDVLLVKWEDSWEIVGDRYNQPISIKSFLADMAKDMGVEITDIELCGLYTQKWKGAPNLSIMNYYKANYVSGELKIPPDCSDIRWFSFEEALGVVPYEHMVRMMKEINKNPGKVIGAAFERYMDDSKKTKFITLEEWHLMN